jgi:small subunit ribosomal protein S4
MARYTDPVCKRCRREQMKLFLKGSRCFSKKCPIEREHPPPGMHGYRKGKLSEYGIRLREKQKLKYFYGLLERQFRRYFAIAARAPENTGEQLLTLMERRLDNVIHRLGFAPNRRSARQLVANGRECAVASAILRPGDSIKVKSRDASTKLVKALMTDNPQPVPDFLEVIPGEQPEGRVTRLPSRGDVDPRIADIREQLIIEIATR